MGADIVIALVLISLVQAFLVKPFRVPSQSMENTLRIGDRIVVSRLPHTITRGDVVVFGHGDTWQQPERPPATNVVVRGLRIFGDLTGIGPSSRTYTVKRVIGLPGDTVGCCTTQGAVTVNGKALIEPYVFEDLPFTPGSVDCASTPASSRCFGPITVPAETLLVLGDHRSQSADSVLPCRGSPTPTPGCARFVPEVRVIGPVVARIWPPGSIGGM